MAMNLSGRDIMKTMASSQRIEGFSAQWKENMTAHVLYPVMRDPQTKVLDLMVAAVWGYDIQVSELKSLHRVFIPCNSEVEDGRPKNPDFLFHFSRLAKLFKKAAQEKEISEIESNDAASKSEKREAVEEITNKYKNTNALVGNLKYKAYTECIFVPLSGEGVPEIKSIKLCSQNLSRSKLKTLYNILDNPQFIVGDDGRLWLEVQYNWGGKGTRQEIGNAVDITGITPGFSCLDLVPIVTEPVPAGIRKEEVVKVVERENGSLEYICKDDPEASMNDVEIAQSYEGEKVKVRKPQTVGKYRKEILEAIGDLPEDVSILMRRNESFIPVDEDLIINAVKSWCRWNYKTLNYLDDDDSKNRIKKSAKMFEELNITFTNESLQAAFEQGLEAAREAEKTGELLNGEEDIQEEFKKEMQEAENEENDQEIDAEVSGQTDTQGSASALAAALKGSSIAGI